jgi:hypothetical protein
MSSEARPLAIKDVTVIDITDAPRMSPHETLIAANELKTLNERYALRPTKLATLQRRCGLRRRSGVQPR